MAETIKLEVARHTESRGAHQHTDFARRHDEKFLAHTLVIQNPDGTSRIEYLSVKITRWPPGEPVYGQIERTTHAL